MRGGLDDRSITHVYPKFATLTAMRLIKILFFSIVLLGVGGVLGVWYVWNQLAQGGAVVTIPGQTSSSSPSTVPISATSSAVLFTKPVTLSTDSLPPAQKKVLETLGISSRQVTITPGMVSCAVDALGSARALELKNGSAPTLAEGLTLVACLKK